MRRWKWESVESVNVTGEGPPSENRHPEVPERSEASRMSGRDPPRPTGRVALETLAALGHLRMTVIMMNARGKTRCGMTR